MAPMVPFITEHVWQVLIRTAQPELKESVHLEDFPISDNKEIDRDLSDSVRLSRRLVELGRAARAESKIKIRQPLARALVAATGWQGMSKEVQGHISDELNVLRIEDISVAGSDLVNISVKANFKTLGAKYGAAVQDIARAINGLDHTKLVKSLRESQQVEITYGSMSAQITLEDLVVTETPKAGWAVASHSGESLALDLELTPLLIESGLVREVIRAIQEARKQANFDVSDRITVEYGAYPDVLEAIGNNLELISNEVLAISMKKVSQTNSDNELGLILKLSKI